MIEVQSLAFDQYADDAARRVVTFWHHGLLHLHMHTIWLPEFRESRTELHLKPEAADLLSTALMHTMHTSRGTP